MRGESAENDALARIQAIRDGVADYDRKTAELDAQYPMTKKHGEDGYEQENDARNAWRQERQRESNALGRGARDQIDELDERMKLFIQRWIDAHERLAYLADGRSGAGAGAGLPGPLVNA